MVELLFPRTLSEDMRDCSFDTLFSLGKACVRSIKCIETQTCLTFVYLFIVSRFGFPVKTKSRVFILKKGFRNHPVEGCS